MATPDVSSRRILELAMASALQKTTAALDDAATRLSRLFLMQLALNATDHASPPV
jgi:hypothetical protein